MKDTTGTKSPKQISIATRNKQGWGVNPRGKRYSTENIMERLSKRELMESLRSNGVETAGPSSLSKEGQAGICRLAQSS